MYDWADLLTSFGIHTWEWFDGPKGFFQVLLPSRFGGVHIERGFEDKPSESVIKWLDELLQSLGEGGVV